MREAVGGSLLLYLIIPIIVLIIVFIGFIMNYASAYRAANYAVSQIESCDAAMGNCDHSSMEKVQEDVKNKYSYMGDIRVCCYENSRGSVYRATLDVEFELPLVGKFSPFSVKSETKTIYGVSCSDRSSFSGC